jgi:hypothetical protein
MASCSVDKISSLYLPAQNIREQWEPVPSSLELPANLHRRTIYDPFPFDALQKNEGFSPGDILQKKNPLANLLR